MLSSALSTNNPIVRAEFNHQRFVIKRGRVGYLWIAMAALLMIPALLASLVTSVSAFLGAFVPQLGALVLSLSFEASSLGAFLNNTGWVLILVMSIAQYVVVTLVTMGLSANSIRREKAGRTWDSLRMTGIGERYIVLGKWWASLHALFGDHVMVTLLRMGLVTLFMTTFANGLDALWQIEPVSHLDKMPAMLLLTIIYGVFDAGLTAALGVVAAIPNEAAGAVVGSIAMGLRIAVIIGAGIWLMLSLHIAINVGMSTVFAMSILGLLIYGLLITTSLLFAEKLVI